MGNIWVVWMWHGSRIWYHCMKRLGYFGKGGKFYSGCGLTIPWFAGHVLPLFSLIFYTDIRTVGKIVLAWLHNTQETTFPPKKAYMGLGFQYQLGLWIQGRWFFLNEMKLWWVLDILSYYSIFTFFLRFFFSSFFSKVVMDLNGMDLVVYIVVCGRVGVRESSSYHLGCLYGNGFHRMVNISMKEAKEQIWYINVDVGGKRVHLWMNHSRR